MIPDVTSHHEPNVCSTCGEGRLVNGQASLPRQCCVVYFFGRESYAHQLWLTHATCRICGYVARGRYDHRASSCSRSHHHFEGEP